MSSKFIQKRNNVLPLFHLAFPMNNFAETRDFYENLLGCNVGRVAANKSWIDFDFFGHQLSAHLDSLPSIGEDGSSTSNSNTNMVDSHQVPIRHFGCILEWNEWHSFRDHLTEKKVEFVIPPYIRFKGLPGEQATMFFKDPSDNALEFKAFKTMDSIYET